MSVRAKFKVDSRTETESGYWVTLSPVYSFDPESENGKFFKWTPSGKIEMGTINETAADALQVGKSFYVDFTLAE